MKTLTLLTLIFSLYSCGKSPFLSESKNNNQVQSIQNLESDIQLTQSNLIIKAYWKNGPSIGDESKLIILLLENDGSLTDKRPNLKVMLWMPSMGHGSFPVTVSRISKGIYEATEVFFTMPGHWDIHFQIYKNDKLEEEAKWPLEL